MSDRQESHEDTTVTRTFDGSDLGNGVVSNPDQQIKM